MKKQFFHRYQVVIFAFSLIITLIIANIPSYALTVNQVPNPRQQNGGWVTDMVDMLSPQAENQLNQMISNLEKANGTEIAIVTVPTTKPSSTPASFTTQLFNTWGIGKQGKNNGILFLVSKGERRTEIETGTGIATFLSNAKVSGIIKQQVTPKFKQGNFEAGILAGTKSLIKELEPKNVTISQTPTDEINSETENTNPFLYIFFILIPFLVWKFIALPFTKFVSSCFTSITKGFRDIKRDYLSPSGVTRRSWPFLNRKVYCKQCSEPMEEVEAKEIEPLLTQPQKVAQEIGSTKFKGWECPNCSLDNMHLLILQFHKASICPTCEELTVTKIRTETIKRATQYSSGTLRTWKQCQCCDYATTTDEMIPQLSRTNLSRRSSTHKFKHHRNHNTTHHIHSYSFDSCDDSNDYSNYDCDDTTDYSSYESSEDTTDYSSYNCEDTTDYSSDDSSSDDSSSDFGGGESDGDGGGDDW